MHRNMLHCGGMATVPMAYVNAMGAAVEPKVRALMPNGWGQ